MRPFSDATRGRWVESQALSGEGSARKGGRFNRPGVAALYLSLDRLQGSNTDCGAPEAPVTDLRPCGSTYELDRV
ncbi:MAG: RES domain-containing protein [Burkholderiaceae bacterium]